MTIILIAIAAGVVALIFALILTMNIMRQDAGSEQVQFIGRAIQQGAMAFLTREYTLLAGFVIVITIILAVLIDFDLTGRVGSSNSIPSTAI